MKKPAVTEDLELWKQKLRRATDGASLPKYLLLVGGPDRFPFELQFAMDSTLFTGRLDASLEPGGPFSWQACSTYARKVVRYEEGQLAVHPKALVYSFTGDPATDQSDPGLARPLVEYLKTLPGRIAGVQTPDLLLNGEALADKLLATLAEPVGPGVVMTISHGLEFPVDPSQWGALSDATHGGGFVSAARVLERKRFAPGAIVFSFACHSAGVPKRSAQRFFAGEEEGELPGGPFTAALPRAALGLAEGPVAFVGHVDRVTVKGFADTEHDKGWQAYQDFLSWMLEVPFRDRSERTLGRALSSLRERAAGFGTSLAGGLGDLQVSMSKPEALVGPMERWMSFYDYRGFMLLGDPALAMTG